MSPAAAGPRPDFLVIGAARSGTTSLARALLRVPGVHLATPLRPEPHFFLKQAEWARGVDWYGRHYFGDAPAGSVRGEKSTSYLCSAEAARRAAACFPDLRLVAMLREPVARAHSSWRFTRAAGLEPLAFSEAIRAEAARLAAPPDTFHREVQPHAYVERSRYGVQLQTWAEHFGRDRLHVIIFERFVADPMGELRRTLAFLGVDAPDVAIASAELGRAHNAAPPVADDAGVDPADRDWILADLAEDRPHLRRMLGAIPPEWMATWPRSAHDDDADAADAAEGAAPAASREPRP